MRSRTPRSSSTAARRSSRASRRRCSTRPPRWRWNKLLAVENAKAAVGNALDGDAYIPKLFISGYTDTVGKPGENQKLLEQRAKAIAEYFHGKGVWSEIYFTGMGEKGLKVQTGDSVDEEKNRRALYVISFQPPTGAVFPSAGAWKRSANARARPKEIPPYPPKWREYEENKRNARSGGSSSSSGGSSSSSGSSSPDSGSSDTGSTDRSDDPDAGSSSRRAGLGEGGGSSEPYFGSADGPPAVEGEPGATKKGCSVQPTELPGALVGAARGHARPASPPPLSFTVAAVAGRRRAPPRRGRSTLAGVLTVPIVRAGSERDEALEEPRRLGAARAVPRRRRRRAAARPGGAELLAHEGEAMGPCRRCLRGARRG